jgi:GDP-4-dehydro-6-deoxy-D-mannose reductase
MKKVIITGSDGFIGKHLVKRLSQCDFEVFSYNRSDGDIELESTWEHFERVDIVIHLAAKSFVPNSWIQPKEFISTNLLGTTEALKFCKKYNSKLLLLSTYLYGNPIKLPIAEDSDLDYTNPYALSKKMAEDICIFYSKFFNLDITILRPFNVYGPGQANHFIIPKICSEVVNNGFVKLGDTSPKRDFIYIDDLIEAIVISINNLRGLNIYNVGSGTSNSIDEVVNSIFKISGISKNYESDENVRPGEIVDCIADIKKINLELGWSPKWSLELGLLEMVKFFKKK